MKRLRLGEADLSAGLLLAPDRGELVLHYQPKIMLDTGAIAGVEALMRWESSRFGRLHPGTFIALAERSGAIDGLTEWGLREALRQWLAWKEQGVCLNIAFNISALTLRDIHFPDYLQRLCQIEGVPCDQLTLEVTEGATQHAIRLLDTLTRFRIKGMGLALDDFGTGYSSLLQLRQLPYTELKVDRCFIADVAHDPESRLIVKSIIDLAHGLGLIATAEGIEDEQTLDLLRELGCDRGQGFLIARPMAGTAVVPWLLERDSGTVVPLRPYAAPDISARASSSGSASSRSSVSSA
jgi:EAL domain-containing protein (putative c-di-GMP-specific phosphodiesterase class I)